MSWDFKMDGETRDWVFTASRDYASVDGMELVRQRVLTRLFIERGSFTYDVNGDLGSRTWDMLKYPHWKSEEQLNVIIQEALAPMDDIEVVEVSFWHYGMPRRLAPQLITYEPSVTQLVVIIRIRLSQEFTVEATNNPLGQDIQVAIALNPTGVSA
jgi:hypothetical protein